MNRKTRRQFLVGSGKTLLALPLLPSLLSKEAFAQSMVTDKRMMMICFPHASLQFLWPDPNLATTSIGTIGAKEFTMNSQFSSAAGICSAMGHSVYESLRSKGQITMIRGLQNFPHYQGHGSQCLGQLKPDDATSPSIDWIMESSSSVYPASTNPYVTKVIRVNNGAVYPAANGNVNGDFTKILNSKLAAQFSYNYNSGSALAMFNTVFASLTGNTVNPADLTSQLKTNILNRVYSSYVSLKANRRISLEDKSRVDEHLSYILDLQKKFVYTGNTLSCTTPQTPSSLTGYSNTVPIYLNLMALAFKCGLTKVSAINFDNEYGGKPVDIDFHGAIHEGLGHQVMVDQYKAWMTWHCNQIGSQFLSPLNVEEGSTGKTYLENMATVLFNENGMTSTNANGHGNDDYHSTIIGSMAGALRANKYYLFPYLPGGPVGERLPYNAYLMTLMQMMGIPAAEYQKYTTDGNGFGLYGTRYSTLPLSRFYAPISEMLA